MISRGLLHDVRVGQGERRPEPGVEPLHEVAGEFEVLTLIFTDRHAVGLIQRDVGRLEDRIA